MRGRPRLIFDGESILFSGREPDERPIAQVRAARQWLKDLLMASSGREVSVRAVVVYPGWFIEPTAEARSSDVWVLNPKALPAFIGNSRKQLSPEDVHLCAFHLAQYVRSVDQSRRVAGG